MSASLLRRLRQPLLYTASPSPPATAAPTAECVLDRLGTLASRNRDPSVALAFFHRSAEQGHPLGSEAYNLMLRTLASRPSYYFFLASPPAPAAHFWPFLRDMEAAGHSVDHHTYLDALCSFKKASLTADYASLAARLAKARNDAQAAGNPFSAADAVSSVTIRWKSYHRQEEDEDLEHRLEAVVELLLPLTETAVAKVLREATDHPVNALAFFRWAGRQEGYAHGSVAYNAMARLLGMANSHEFWELIKEMKAGAMHLDVDNYEKLSSHFQILNIQDGMSKAVRLYEIMMDGPYKPSQPDGSLLLSCIARGPSADLELAYRVVSKIEAVYEFKTKEVFDGIHRALLSNHRFDEAAEVMQDMRAAGHQPDIVTYNQLVYWLCEPAKCDEARKVIEEMEAQGCTPNLKTWTLLIQGHCETGLGEVDKALHYLAEMIDKNLVADAYLLFVIVKPLCRSQNQHMIHAAYTLFAQMVDKPQSSPWQHTYTHIVSDLLRVKKLGEAYDLLMDLQNLEQSRKLPPFVDPFPTNIAEYGKREDARDFFKALKGSSDTYRAYNIYLLMFESFFAGGRYSEAQDLLYKCIVHIRKHHDIAKPFESIKVETTS